MAVRRITGLVMTSSGPVVGLEEGGLNVFRGIPYAEAPFGARRFLAPAQHEPWTEPRAAFAFGPTAPQKEGASPGGLPDVREPIIPGEEILNLNVWTPALGTAQQLPVLVWIHGGGFFAGCSANPWYDGASFARQGIVVVSVNYRLGAEGFLEVEGAATNRALRDWISALSWVRDNICGFGGDSGRVTVMGQSAGGAAVGALLASPASAGLFHQAIIASGVTDRGFATTEQARQVGRSVAAFVGGLPTRDSMLGVDPRRFVEVHGEMMEEAARIGADIPRLWAPSIDGQLLREPLFEAVAIGRGAEIPILTGTTENEFAWRILRAEPESDEAYEKAQEIYSNVLFRRPTENFVQLRVDHAAAPTYRYEFRWKSTAAPYILAGHSLDIPFFFNNLGAPFVEAYSGPNPPQQLASLEHEAFARYVRDGNPGWPAYGENKSFMVFDLESRVDAGLRI